MVGKPIHIDHLFSRNDEDRKCESEINSEGDAHTLSRHNDDSK